MCSDAKTSRGGAARSGEDEAEGGGVADLKDVGADWEVKRGTLLTDLRTQIRSGKAGWVEIC